MKKYFRFLKLDDCSLYSTSEVRIICLTCLSLGSLCLFVATVASFLF